MEPGKQAFDFPASAIAPESAPVLGFGPTAVRFVGRDQLDAVLLLQTRIQRIAVISAVVKRCWTVGSTSLVSWGEALAIPTATGKPRRSAIAMILVPLPRRVGPTAPPPFLHC